MPLIRRLPKRGFNNAAFHKSYAIVNLRDLNEFKTGTVVNEQLLRDSKLVRGDVSGIKILGDGELKHALKIEVNKISASAREKIDKVGGTVTLRERVERPATREDADGAAKEDQADTSGSAVAKKRSTKASRATPKKKTSRKR